MSLFVKVLAVIILNVAILGVSNVNAQDLDVRNNKTVTVSVSSTYNDINLGQNSTLIIPSGVIVDAQSLNVLNKAVIKLDGRLNILNNVNVSNKAGLTVNSTGVMDVGGNVTANNNSFLDLGGTVTIDGDLDASKADITVDGVVAVGGTFTGTVGSGSGTLTSGNLNNYNQPLPVALIYANIDVVENEIKIDWATSAEINNDFFTIKISSDLTDWKTVNKIDGVGNSNIMTAYSYSFVPDYSGQVYIQLSQTDYDGTTEILKVMTVEVDKKDFSIYPNPMRAGQTLNIKGISNNDKVRIFNSGMVPVDNNDMLERGFYYVIINDSEVHKLIVK